MTDELRPGSLRSAVDLFQKLKRDRALLHEEVTSDRFFNFVVTGYSLIDWIKNDSALPSLAKTRLEVDALYDDRWLKICGDLATAAKHFQLTRRDPITESTEALQGFGLGRYGKGAYGVGEESIVVKLLDGTEINVLELADGVVDSWRSYFDRHRLAIEASDPGDDVESDCR